MIFIITKEDVTAQYGTMWSIARQIVDAMTDDAVEVEITVDISGNFYRETLETPAEYPECTIDCVEMSGKVVGGELAETLIGLCGGEEAVRSKALHEAQMEADEGRMMNAGRWL